MVGFLQNGEKITQPMVFPRDHSKFPDQPKGMKQVLQEHGLWVDGLTMKCRKVCTVGSADCCAKQLLQLQPDFKEQLSGVMPEGTLQGSPEDQKGV